ncbi:MAG: DUF3536 domain-containing protein, partial [Nitrososphaerales archaeon]
AKRDLSEEEKGIVLKLLEMQRNSLLMYTSCGWFFDEISDIETIQVMRYAARAMQLVRRVFGIDLTSEYMNMLEKAPSNNPNFKNGAEVFKAFVIPHIVDLLKVGMHYAISSLFTELRPSNVYCYEIDDEVYEEYKLGRFKLIIGKFKVFSNITWSKTVVSYSTLWFGDHNVIGGIKEHMNNEEFMSMRDEIKSSFEKAEIQKIITLMDKYFGMNIYSLKNLFKDEQRRIIQKIMRLSITDAESYYKRIFEDNYPTMKFLKEIGINPPKALKVAADIVISSKILDTLTSKEINLDLLKKLVDYTKELSIDIDKSLIGLEASSRIVIELKKLMSNPEDLENLKRIKRLVELLNELPIQLDLWYAQNIIFSLCKQYYKFMKERSKSGDKSVIEWLVTFDKLCELLKVKILGS